MSRDSALKTKILTAIPVRDGEAFVQQTLESLARQTRRPDRVVVLDNCSTDHTPDIVRGFKSLACEYIRNPTNLGLFGNFNRCLDFADQAEYLQILHADDVLEPEFYAVMLGLLEDCEGRGMAWCLDERIDERNQTLSVSGKADGRVEILNRDTFLRRKAEIGNQAFCATLLKTCGQPAPCRFPMDMPIVGDMVYWAAYGTHCRKIVQLHRVLAKYRWHGANTTSAEAPSLQALILDEWRVMEHNEALRGTGWSPYRQARLKGLLAVRSGIKAKRTRQNGNAAYAAEIVRTARAITGWPLWVAGQVLVELREWLVFRIGRRPRYPRNIYS